MRRLYSLVLVLAALALVFVAAVAVLQSGWFKNKVREGIVAEVENSTGGRVEIGEFNYNWRNSTAEVSQFVLHGTEPTGAPALFRASRIHVGLKIISFIERTTDIASLSVEKPEIHILVKADGTTNLPTPKAVRRGDLVAEILNLKVQHFTLAGGVAEYNSQRIPLDLRADNLTASLRYLGTPSRYAGEISSHQVHVSGGSFHDEAFDLVTKLAIERNRIQIENATLTQNRSTMQLSGTLADVGAPRAELQVKSRLFVADLPKSLKLPIESRGEIAFTGTASIASLPLRYTIEGRVNGRNLAFESKTLRLRNAAVSSAISVTPAGIQLQNLDVAALDGHFRGSATLQDLKRFQVKGVIEGFSVQQLAAIEGQTLSELNGTLTGPVEAQGVVAANAIEDLKLHATLQIVPGQTGVPIGGSLEANYDQRAGIVQFGNSNLTLGTTVVTTTGNLGQALTMHLTSSNLHDFMLALPLIGETAPQNFPIKLVRGGTAQFDGTVVGPLANSTISGRLQLTTFEVEKQSFHSLDATLDATKTRLHVRALTVDGDPGHLTGSGELGLVDWRPVAQSPLQASVQVSRPLSKLAYLPVTAALSAAGTVSGTYGSPQAAGHVQLEKVAAYDESFNRVVADVKYLDQTIEVLSGRATSGKAEVDFSGVYNYPVADPESGRTRFHISSKAFPLAQIRAVASRRKGVEGQVDVQANGDAHFVKGDFQLDDLDGQVSLHNAAVDGKRLGDIQAVAKTRGQTLDISADADLRGTQDTRKRRMAAHRRLSGPGRGDDSAHDVCDGEGPDPRGYGAGFAIRWFSIRGGNGVRSDSGNRTL